VGIPTPALRPGLQLCNTKNRNNVAVPSPVEFVLQRIHRLKRLASRPTVVFRYFDLFRHCRISSFRLSRFRRRIHLHCVPRSAAGHQRVNMSIIVKRRGTREKSKGSKEYAHVGSAGGSVLEFRPKHMRSSNPFCFNPVREVSLFQSSCGTLCVLSTVIIWSFLFSHFRHPHLRVVTSTYWLMVTFGRSAGHHTAGKYAATRRPAETTLSFSLTINRA
jgi:hypothetical protein